MDGENSRSAAFEHSMRTPGILFVLFTLLSSANLAEELRVQDSEVEGESIKPISYRVGETEYSGIWSSFSSLDEKFTPIVFSSAATAFRPQVGVGYGPKGVDGTRPVRFYCKPYSNGPELPLDRRIFYYFHTDGVKKREVEAIGEFDVRDTEAVIRQKAVAALKQFLEATEAGRGARRPESK